MKKIITIIATCTILSACSSEPKGPQDIFFDKLLSHCGQSYGGKLVSDDRLDKAMAGKAMAINFTACTDTQVRIPFHIERSPGEWDRSRTWVITRTENGLRLKHDHRHEDGSADKVTQYGGDTPDAGTGDFQSFPADQESKDMFSKNSLTTSSTNIWSIAITDGENAQYSYQMERINRKFRVEFDLSKPIATPPPAWGDEPQDSKTDKAL